jgi:glycerol-3-phosphate dehydrogenase
MTNGWNFCRIEDWCDPGARMLAYVSVREVEQDGAPCWAVRVDARGISAWELERRVVLHTPGTYAQAWALGADLVRALERRGADGRRP